jgi:hypothetical protein
VAAQGIQPFTTADCVVAAQTMDDATTFNAGDVINEYRINSRFK